VFRFKVDSPVFEIHNLSLKARGSRLRVEG
jgi:hypothetical protein